MDTIHGVDAALMNKGIKSVTLRTKQNKPTQRLFFLLLESRRNVQRGQGVSITHNILDYIGLLLILKKQETQITLISPLIFINIFILNLLLNLKYESLV